MSMKPLNDKMIANLINNAQMGKDAFEQILRYYQHDIFRIIRVYTQNDSDAEDLTQETWLKVYRSIGKLKPPYHFESWLKKVAVNTAKDWLKSRARKESQATDTIVPQQLRGRAMLEYQKQGLIERLRDAIDSLSAKRRQVVLDFYICGYSIAEISQRLNIPQSTVTGRLQEARKQLRQEFSTMFATLTDDFVLQIAQSGIQEKFAPDTLVRTVMDRVGNLPDPPPFSGGNTIQRIGRLLPKGKLPIIGTATLIALTVISIIVINLSNYKPSGNGNQEGNLILGAGLWRKRADMPTPRVGLSTAVVNDKIYAVGGASQGPVKTVEVYDPATDTWTAKASMPTPRYAVSTAVTNDKIYAIGGLTTLNGELRALSTVEEYDPETDTWIAKANMPTPRGEVALAVVNDKIYAIGGGSIDGILSVVVYSTVEMYDPQTDTWTPRADMPTPRTFLSASVVNNKIYAIGGWTGEKVGALGKGFSTMEVYDPAQDMWLKGVDMPTARWAFSTNVVGEKIYAVGGTTIIGEFPNSRRWNWKAIKTVEAYDPATGIWTTEIDMPTKRAGLSTSAVEGKLYAIGGSQGEPDWIPLPKVEEFDK